MKLLLTTLAAATSLALAGPGPRRGELLRTDYERGRVLRIERESFGSERLVEFSMERDGEPVDHPGRGEGARTSRRRETWVDRIVESEDGEPRVVVRTCELARLESGEGGEEQTSPLEDGELRLALDGEGGFAIEADGVEDELLAGQELTLALDALLPEGEVAAGDSWELDGDAVARGLGLEVAAALFPRPDFDPDEFRARRERGEGPPAFLRRDSSLRLLRAAEWEAQATLTDRREERGGLEAVAIELELEGQGELEEERFGRGRGGRATGLPGAGRTALATEFELELEGLLWFAPAEGLPVELELEGTFFMESETERDMGGSVFSMYRVNEGEFRQNVTVSFEEE